MRFTDSLSYRTLHTVQDLTTRYIPLSERFFFRNGVLKPTNSIAVSRNYTASNDLSSYFSYEQSTEKRFVVSHFEMNSPEISPSLFLISRFFKQRCLKGISGVQTATVILFAIFQILRRAKLFAGRTTIK